MVTEYKAANAQKSDIYGVLLNLAGSPFSSTLEIAGGSADQLAPAVAYSAGEWRYLAVW